MPCRVLLLVMVFAAGLGGCVSVPLAKYSDGRPNPLQHMPELIAQKRIVLGKSTTAEVVEILAAEQEGRNKLVYGPTFFYHVNADRVDHTVVLSYYEPVLFFQWGQWWFVFYPQAGEGADEACLQLKYDDQLKVTSWSRAPHEDRPERLTHGSLRRAFGERTGELQAKGYLPPDSK